MADKTGKKRVKLTSHILLPNFITLNIPCNETTIIFQGKRLFGLFLKTSYFFFFCVFILTTSRKSVRRNCETREQTMRNAHGEELDSRGVAGVLLELE